ncbi:MAG: hypothetical protein HQ541_02445 [Mariniphaga sp.]|nr:hypothetical protein [Mariniphaga sp.]
MAKSLVNTNAKFGTMPVFLTALSTILGAILFLRFGWAVGQVGFFGVIGIIILGHIVTIPTAFAFAEIATNQRVQGGGVYYIIFRSFGFNIDMLKDTNEFVSGYNDIGNILFVNANKVKTIN